MADKTTNWAVVGWDEVNEEKQEQMVRPDPHGIVRVFAERLNSNLRLMAPGAAAREAMQTVDEYLKASRFINMSYKSSTEPQYVRVWKTPARSRQEFPERG